MPFRTERNLELVILAGHVHLMVEIRLAVDVGRHLLTIDLILLLVHLGLVLRSDLATSLVDLTVILMDLTIVLVDLTVILMDLTVILADLAVILTDLAVVLADLASVGTVVLLDPCLSLSGASGAGTDLGVDLIIIECSCHRYREDKS